MDLSESRNIPCTQLEHETDTPAPCMSPRYSPDKEALDLAKTILERNNEDLIAKISATLAATVARTVVPLATASNADALAKYNASIQAVLASQDNVLASHIAETKKRDADIEARLLSLESALETKSDPACLNGATPKSAELVPNRITKMHAPELVDLSETKHTPCTQFAIQYTKNYVDLRADLDLLPERHGPVRPRALLDRPLIDPSPDFAGDTPWDNFLDSLSPEEFEQRMQEMWNETDPYFETPAALDLLLSASPGTPAADAAP